MFKLYFGIVLLSLFIVFVQHAVKVIHFMGYHVTVFNHFPGPCHLIPGVDHGSEDMETLPDGRTFITSGMVWSISSDTFKKLYEHEQRQGKILYFDFKQPNKGVTELEFDKTFDQSNFHPHGISVIQSEDTGQIFLFVVNHYPGTDIIEKFEFIEDKMMLQHKMSYVDDAIRLVNDVAATSENSFYFTNYGYARDHLKFLLELGLFLPFGNVVYYDGAGYEVVSESLVIPNGIALSQDHRSVYVAHGAFMSVNIYRRAINDSLTLVQEYPIYSGPDNILIEPKSGNLVIATHPATYLVAAYMDNPTLAAPSKVLMLNMADNVDVEGITEVYSEDGSLLSASTVASIYDNKMLVGSIFSHLMYCEIRYAPWQQPQQTS